MTLYPKWVVEEGQTYAERVFDEYGFRHITILRKDEALGIVNESVHHRKNDSEYRYLRLKRGTIVGLMNKGAYLTRWPRLWVVQYDSRYWLAEQPREDGTFQ